MPIRVRKGAIENVNSLVKKCKENKILILERPNAVSLLRQLNASIMDAGDYGFQVHAVEIMYRMVTTATTGVSKQLPSNLTQDTAAMQEIFQDFPESKEIMEAFAKIRPTEDHFLGDLREFVNCVNQTIDVTKRRYGCFFFC